MAFNPFSSFRKYQKFWMAAVLLISMVTFVLCSGVGNRGGSEGELGQMILNAFRNRGEVYATFNGSNLYVEEATKLRDQRNLANAFLQNCKKVAKAQTENALRNEEAKKDPEAIRGLEFLRDRYDGMLRQKQHFLGGVKLQDLLDFKSWLAEADRLDIQLNNEMIQLMVYQEMLGHIQLSQKFRIFDLQGFYAAQNETISQAHLRQATLQNLMRAVTDEYRVRIAQEALAMVQPKQVKDNEGRFRDKVVLEPRGVPTPDQLWQFYRSHISPHTVTMLPVRADAFLKDVGEPTEDQLKALFEQGKHAKYDPHSEKPGFEQPLRAKIAFVTADPDSAHYKMLAKVMSRAVEYPFASYSPMAPQLFLVRLAAGKAFEEASLEQTYETRLQSPDYLAPSMESTNLPLHLTHYHTLRRPAAIAALTAGASNPAFGLTAFSSLAAPDFSKHAEAIKSAVAAERARRVPPFATLVAGTAMSPWMYLGMNEIIETGTRQFLPLSVVRDKVETVQDRSIASQFAVDAIVELRRKIEALPQQNNKAQLDRALAPFLNDKRVELKEAAKSYSRYDIGSAKELEPLHKAFEKEVDRINLVEGRKLLGGLGSVSAPLERDDFWKLFFDGSEPFSVSGAPYGPKPFPPDLTPGQGYFRNKRQFQFEAMKGGLDRGVMESVSVVLDQPEVRQPKIAMLPFAEKPFLFWKTEEHRPFAPESLDVVRGQVAYAWKLDRARDLKAFAFAEKIARELANAGNPLLNGLRLEQEALQMGTRAVTLPYVAEYVQKQAGQLEPFAIDKKLLDDPRDGISQQILSILDLKKPLEFGNTAIDNLNKALYDQVSGRDKNPRGKFVQVIPNKPRTILYVVAAGPPESVGIQFSEFAQVWGFLPFLNQMAERNPDQVAMQNVATRALEFENNNVYQAILEQFRKTYRARVEASDKTRASFDTDNSGGGD